MRLNNALGNRQPQAASHVLSPRGLPEPVKDFRQIVAGNTWAAIQGRDFVVPDDIKSFARPALAHRLVLDPSLWGSKKTENAVIEGVISSVPVPVIQAAHE